MIFVLTMILCNIVMYEMVKKYYKLYSLIHDSSSPIGWARQTTGFNLVSYVISVNWLTSRLGIRLNWVFLPQRARSGLA
jgi:hypothetical protein